MYMYGVADPIPPERRLHRYLPMLLLRAAHCAVHLDGTARRGALGLCIAITTATTTT